SRGRAVARLALRLRRAEPRARSGAPVRRAGPSRRALDGWERPRPGRGARVRSPGTTEQPAPPPAPLARAAAPPRRGAVPHQRLVLAVVRRRVRALGARLLGAAVDPRLAANGGRRAALPLRAEPRGPRQAFVERRRDRPEVPSAAGRRLRCERRLRARAG